MSYTQVLRRRCGVQAIAAALRSQFTPGDVPVVLRGPQGRWQVRHHHALTPEQHLGQTGVAGRWPERYGAEEFAGVLLAAYNSDAF